MSLAKHIKQGDQKITGPIIKNNPMGFYNGNL